MLAEKQLRGVIGPILRKRLGSGRDRFAIEFGEDHDGDPSIFIVAKFKLANPETRALVMLDSLHEIREELRKHGDPRLPYFRHKTSELPQEVAV